MAGPMAMRGAKKKVENPGKLFVRLMRYVLRKYKIHCFFVVVFICVGVLANVQGTLFTKNLIDQYITPFLLTDEPDLDRLREQLRGWRYSMRSGCFLLMLITGSW